MSCYGYIIGKKGETKKRLESETNTSINIPKQGQQGDVSEYEICYQHWSIKYLYLNYSLINEILYGHYINGSIEF